MRGEDQKQAAMYSYVTGAPSSSKAAPTRHPSAPVPDPPAHVSAAPDDPPECAAPTPAQQVTLGADTQYQDAGFVQHLRDRAVAPHVSEYVGGNLGKNSLSEKERADARRTISQKKRKLIEKVFGWAKLIGLQRQVKVRGLAAACLAPEGRLGDTSGLGVILPLDPNPSLVILSEAQRSRRICSCFRYFRIGSYTPGNPS